MDFSSIIGTIMSKDSLDGLAQKTGASFGEVKEVLSSALPNLLNGAGKQASDSDTSEGFANALTQHAGNDTSNLASFFSKVDLSDGAKIVGHLLGKKDNDEKKASEADNSAQAASGSNSNSIISAAAPLLMSLLGKQNEIMDKLKAANKAKAVEASGTVAESTKKPGHLGEKNASSKKAELKHAAQKKADSGAKGTLVKKPLQGNDK